MAAAVRQPFAPVDGTRLQSLSSLKNTQNSIPFTSPGKRKAPDVLDTGDFENVDPANLFTKRSKSTLSDKLGQHFFSKPSTFHLTKSSPTSVLSSTRKNVNVPVKAPADRARPILNPKSPAKKLSSLKSSTPKSAPAGRSPTRGPKRTGILTRRRAGTFSRIDPPSFNLTSTPFSLDAAIKGTLPSYAPRSVPKKASYDASDDLRGPTMKSSWFFDIHEDTPEQEMTNFLQHSTCMLDISSDEECGQKARREKAEGPGKENIPPPDDRSQTSFRRSNTVVSPSGMEYEKPRVALGDLNVEDFYAPGVDPTEVIIVRADDEDGTIVDGEHSSDAQQDQESVNTGASTKTDIDTKGHTLKELVEPEMLATPMTSDSSTTTLDVASESFDLWESSSAKEEAEAAQTAVPDASSI